MIYGLIPTGGLVDSYGFAGNRPEMAGTSPLAAVWRGQRRKGFNADEGRRCTRIHADAPVRLAGHWLRERFLGTACGALEHVHCDWNRQRTRTLTRRAAARRPLPQSGRGGRWCGVSTQPELALTVFSLTGRTSSTNRSGFSRKALAHCRAVAAHLDASAWLYLRASARIFLYLRLESCFARLPTQWMRCYPEPVSRPARPPGEQARSKSALRSREIKPDSRGTRAAMMGMERSSNSPVGIRCGLSSASLTGYPRGAARYGAPARHGWLLICAAEPLLRRRSGLGIRPHGARRRQPGT